MSLLMNIIENIKTHRPPGWRGQTRFMVALAVGLLTLGILSPRHLGAKEHVVSLEEIHGQIQAANEIRDSHLREIQGFISSQAVAKKLTAAGLDAAQVKNLVPMLDDSEIERLAERTRGIERDLAAGALNNQQLTYIVIALATAIVVLLAT